MLQASMYGNARYLLAEDHPLFAVVQGDAVLE
jgi:hypothetical protein